MACPLEVPERVRLSEDQELRPLAESYVDELHALIEANRAHLARWLPWASDQSRDDTLAFLRAAREQAAKHDGFGAAIFKNDRIVGVVGFRGVDRQHRSTSIGYWLAKDAEGHGTMTRAVGAMVDWAFNVWKLNRVEIRAVVANRGSRAVIERLGFRYEGTARQAFHLADGYHDEAVYALLAGQWRSARTER